MRCGTKSACSAVVSDFIKYLHARRLESELHIYMEYADNGNLSSAIKKLHGAPFATSQVTDWLRPASALEHVHSREVLQRRRPPTSS